MDLYLAISSIITINYEDLTRWKITRPLSRHTYPFILIL